MTGPIENVRGASPGIEVPGPIVGQPVVQDGGTQHIGVAGAESQVSHEPVVPPVVLPPKADPVTHHVEVLSRAETVNPVEAERVRKISLITNSIVTDGVLSRRELEGSGREHLLSADSSPEVEGFYVFGRRLTRDDSLRRALAYDETSVLQVLRERNWETMRHSAMQPSAVQEDRLGSSLLVVAEYDTIRHLSFLPSRSHGMEDAVAGVPPEAISALVVPKRILDIVEEDLAEVPIPVIPVGNKMERLGSPLTGSPATVCRVPNYERAVGEILDPGSTSPVKISGEIFIHGVRLPAATDGMQL